jgi:hypothetical protein
MDRIGDLLAAGHRVFKAGELLVHLLRRAEIILVPIHLHPRGVGAELAGVNAEENVLSVGVFAIDVVSVARGDERKAELPGRLDRAFHRQTLNLHAVVHHLDEVAVAEESMEPLGRLHRFPELIFGPHAAQYRPVELAGDAARKANDPFVMALEQLFINPRLEVEPFQVRRRGQLHQILEARAVLRQEGEVITGLLHVAGVFLQPTARGDIRFVPDDRVDPRRFRLAIEL